MAQKLTPLRHLLMIAVAGMATVLPLPTLGSAGPPAVNPALAGDQLRTRAAQYRALAPLWTPVDAGDTLQPGNRGLRVAQLRALLELYGDYRGLPGPLRESRDHRDLYHRGLERAVAGFQRRHGLEPNGTAGGETLAALRVSPLVRAQQLELNARRWDQLPPEPGERYVLINVPEFRLQLIQRGQVTLSMKTVVGKGTRRTPELTTSIASIVFNPDWTVPRSILLTELLPKARNNPEAMHKRGYRVVHYRGGKVAPISEDTLDKAARGRATLRQISGPENSLGRVKFVIPNNQSIFLHDTQAQSLFQLNERAHSHGCVRLERPRELAYALLKQQGWDRMRVAEATTGDRILTIRVEQPPRLFITYFTAWVDPDGQTQFRNDIYHKDTLDTPPQ